MDWEKINLLLDIVHKAQDVGNTSYIVAKALEELRTINAPAVPVAPTIADPQLDLKLGARKL